MTEKQTPSSESVKKPDTGEVISDEDYTMLKEWEREDAARAAEAARRTVETKPPVHTVPVAETTLSTTSREAPVVTTGMKVARGAAAVGVGVAVTAGLYGIAGGDNNPDRGEPDPTLNSITLSPDANIRQDPKVDDAVTGPNTLFQPGAEVRFENTDNIRVVDTTDNGTWYGFNSQEMATKIPAAENIHDDDGIVWVNEAGVISVDKDSPEVPNQ